MKEKSNVGSIVDKKYKIFKFRVDKSNINKITLHDFIKDRFYSMLIMNIMLLLLIFVLFYDLNILVLSLIYIFGYIIVYKLIDRKILRQHLEFWYIVINTLPLLALFLIIEYILFINNFKIIAIAFLILYICSFIFGYIHMDKMSVPSEGSISKSLALFMGAVIGFVIYRLDDSTGFITLFLFLGINFLMTMVFFELKLLMEHNSKSMNNKM